VDTAPAIGADGTVYFGSSDRKIYAIKTASNGLAKSPWPMFGKNMQHTSQAGGGLVNGQLSGRPNEGRPSGRPNGVSRKTMQEQMLKQFDKNGDGKLDVKEQPTREQLQVFLLEQARKNKTSRSR